MWLYVYDSLLVIWSERSTDTPHQTECLTGHTCL